MGYLLNCWFGNYWKLFAPFICLLGVGIANSAILSSRIGEGESWPLLEWSRTDRCPEKIDWSRE